MISPRTLLFLAVPGFATSLLAQEDFCQSPLGVSHLLTPGSATCEVMGQSTTVTLFDNTVIEWDSIVLTPSQRLEFAFANPQHTVVNRSLGTAVFPVIGTAKPTLIGGTLVSNGNVVILSPNNLLQFSNDARVEVGSLLVSGLGGDSAQFFSDSGPIELNATPLTNPTTLIRGEITTTNGDVVLVGKELEITGTINSAGSVTAVTGAAVRLNRSGFRVAEAAGGSQIIQGGTIRARGDIAFVSQQAISMSGEISPGSGQGRLFTRVNEDGQILVGPAGLTVNGTSVFSTPPVGEAPFIGLDEGDSPAARSPAINELPTLRINRSSARARPTSASITSRAPSSFTKRKTPTSKRKRVASSSGVPEVRKRSFFGTRSTLTQR